MGRIVPGTMKTHFFESKTTAYFIAAVMVVLMIAPCRGQSSGSDASANSTDLPPVITPPESLFQKYREADRDAARQFYKKYIDLKGMPVIASGEVEDRALQRTYYIVTHMLAG